MTEAVTRTHDYNAEGNTLRGSVLRPLNQEIASQANVALPAIGGFVCSVGGPFHHEKIVSVSSSYSHVTGNLNPKSGGWSTLVTTVVEDLNILEVVTADRVISRISLEHPAIGYAPKMTLVGSNFINLRIAGFPVEAMLNFSLLTPADEYPESPWLENPSFLDAARQQFRRRVKGSPISKELEERYGWIETAEGIKKRGTVACSLVDSIVGTYPGQASGNMLYIPEVGKFYFGELVVHAASFRLTMIRADLGSPLQASLGVGDSLVNGNTYP